MKGCMTSLKAWLLHGLMALAAVVSTGALYAAETTPDDPALGLEGYPVGRRPDIVFLEPKLIEPVRAYANAMELMATHGMTLLNAELTQEGVQTEGIVPVLREADYRILQVKDVPWKDACDRLLSLFLVRKKARTEEVSYQPLCAFISEEVTPKVLEETLLQLMDTDAMLFLLPDPKTVASPAMVYWRNLVCPGAQDVQTIRNVHWIPTFAEIIGLPNPASIPEPSLLPLLTSVGYQRPLEASTIQLPLPKHRDVYTTVWYYTLLDGPLPWIPDYTCDSYKPERRHFVRSILPLRRDAVRNIPFRKLDRPQGLYLRTTQSELDLVLPKDVSCVVRIKGKTVLDRWEPKDELHWRMEHSTPVPVDFFVLIPADMSPLDLPFFEQKEILPLLPLLPKPQEAP